MNRAAVIHKAGQNFAFPVDEHSLKLRLKAARSDLKEVKVIYGSRYPLDYKDPYLIKEMELVGSDSLYDYFETTIELDDNRFRYYFYLDDGDKGIWFSEKGFTDIRPHGVWGFGEYFQYPVINKNDIFDAPEWVRDAVFYQIFPERFYNANQNNDPEGVKEWGGKPRQKSFFGGDLEGIIKKMEYLEELGINALYLTPIFTSSSNHKYNIDDYYSIDPAFGDINIAKKLVETAHQRGIRVVLDAVFNHCGYDFFAFKDVRENGNESRYIDWFFVDETPVKTSSPVNYYTFANDIKNMPKLNTSNPEVQEYLLEVAEYWIKEINIDGWRLDVADEVDHQFWRKFRERVRSMKKDIYIVGENWHNSEDWLQGDQFDAIMNYPLGMAVLDFFSYNRIGPAEFNNRLIKNWMLYQDEVNYSMLNLLDSHDTPRLLNLFSGDKQAMKLAVMFQLTYPGAPMIYYGDEIGMEGEG
ncbi:MAG: glycoside hydrolase family 13 protein, partial [Halanaerobiales bacterium]